MRQNLASHKSKRFRLVDGTLQILELKGPKSLRQQVDDGLPAKALKVLARQIDPKQPGKVEVILASRASLARLTKKPRMGRELSERTERVARILALATDVFGSAASARQFLLSPHLELGDQLPLHVATSELGAREVEQILMSIRFGLPV